MMPVIKLALIGAITYMISLFSICFGRDINNKRLKRVITIAGVIIGITGIVIVSIACTMRYGV